MNATQYTLENDQIIEIMENSRKTIYGILSDDSQLPSVVSRGQQDISYIDPVFNISENFDIIPSHLHIMTINLNESPFRLNQYINEHYRNEYDVIILDSPPTISAYTKVSLLSSDYYIVPMKLDFLSLFGLPLLQNYIDRLKKEFEKNIDFLGIILTMVRPDWRIYSEIKEKLEERPEWKNKLFDSELKYKIKIAKALSPEERDKHSQYIIDLNDGELKDQIIEITKELITKGRL